MTSDSSTFYEDLPVVETYESTADLSRYQEIPSDWSLAMTDVVDSTEAVESGRYKEVNILGAATIMSLLNITGYNQVPYVFAGDGATVALPPDVKQGARDTLAGLRGLASSEFDLALRAALIPVRALKNDDVTLLVSRHRISPHLTQAHFAGGGLDRAEELIRSDTADEYLVPESPEQNPLDITGLECRWEKVPARREEIVSILVKVLEPDPERRSRIYQDVINVIDSIYSAEETARPVHPDDLQVTRSPDDLVEEIKVLTHGSSRLWRWIYSTGLWILAHIGYRLMKYGIQIGDADWGQYRDIAVQNTDFRKFGDQVMQVLAGTAEQRKQLEEELEKRRQQGDLVYGIHPSNNAYLTCLVSDYDTQHFHLVDGADGGYTEAAAQLKPQLEDC